MPQNIRSPRSFATCPNGAVTQKVSIPPQQWRGCSKQEVELGVQAVLHSPACQMSHLNFNNIEITACISQAAAAASTLRAQNYSLPCYKTCRCLHSHPPARALQLSLD